MIPKKIHYCWFGGKPLPEAMKRNIESWKKFCPGYEIICWDEKNYDINNSIPFVKQAYACKKFAFVSDYVRLEALYREGGIYMDTDVELVKPLDDFLHHRFFTSTEYIADNVRILNVKDRLYPDGTKRNPEEIIIGIGIMSAFWGVEPRHPFMSDCLNFYKTKNFILPDGSYYDKVILTVVLALCAEKYGFKYKKGPQELREGMFLYPDEYFTYVGFRTVQSVALHAANNSWRRINVIHKLYAKCSQYKALKVIKVYLMSNHTLCMFFDYIKKKLWIK